MGGRLSMTSQTLQPKNEILNAAFYIDFENVFELLKRYGVSPITIDFFPVLLDKFKNEYNLNLVECIAYSNFEKKSFQEKCQTTLHNLGIQTRHTASNGKNSADMMLTVDCLTTLYKVPHINVFIIVSSDRDMMALIGAIKRENKKAYLLSTKYGFNVSVSKYATYHAYIEDIFGLTPEMLVACEETPEIIIRGQEFDQNDLACAKEVSKLLYSSHIWQIYENEGTPVTLNGYLKAVSPKIGATTEHAVKIFKLAHHNKFITIYRDVNKGLCLKKGENYQAVIEWKEDSI